MSRAQLDQIDALQIELETVKKQLADFREREARRLERLAERPDGYTADFKEGVRQCALMIRVGPTTTPLDEGGQ